jgi:hypothetical protein
MSYCLVQMPKGFSEIFCRPPLRLKELYPNYYKQHSIKQCMYIKFYIQIIISVSLWLISSHIIAFRFVLIHIKSI